MSDDSIQRLIRLAERAKELDDLIQNAAKMNKQIIEEIRRIAERDKVKVQRPTATPKPGPKASQRDKSRRAGPRGR